VVVYKKDCSICGAELLYTDALSEKECFICGNKFQAQVACVHNHYVCDECHTTDPLSFLEVFIQRTLEKSPFNMLMEIMRHPSYAMHGPEHHYLIPVVFLAAIKNNGYAVPENFWKLVKARGNDLPGGTCGYWGACAAAIGAGVATSILKECNPLKKDYYGEIHAITSAALADIAKVGGPRCCKRNVFLTALSLHSNLQSIFNIKLPEEKILCTFMKNNKECLGNVCPFFPQKAAV